MQTSDVIRGAKSILAGRKPFLSIEITSKCRLRCPKCYAYENVHLNTGTNLRNLSDHRDQKLIDNTKALIELHQPQHISWVGGEPLMVVEELMELLPWVDSKGINSQLVTSADFPLPIFDPPLKKMDIVVSIDGLQPEHDKRRKPATYKRILENIAGRSIIVHCTITGTMMAAMRKNEGYLDDFLHFWTQRSEVKKIWISTLTPQKGDRDPDFPTIEERNKIVQELLTLRKIYSKLDMLPEVTMEFLRPPRSPKECIFAQTTHTISADLKTVVYPCQFGGDPDCDNCGCIASMGLAALGHKTLKDANRFFRYVPFVRNIQLGTLFQISRRVGKISKGLRIT